MNTKMTHLDRKSKYVRNGLRLAAGVFAIYVGTCASAMAQSNLGPKAPRLACVNDSPKWGYVDSTGKVVITPRFDATSSFSERLAAVQVNGKWGYIDTSGNV